METINIYNDIIVVYFDPDKIDFAQAEEWHQYICRAYEDSDIERIILLPTSMYLCKGNDALLLGYKKMIEDLMEVKTL